MYKRVENAKSIKEALQQSGYWPGQLAVVSEVKVYPSRDSYTVVPQFKLVRSVDELKAAATKQFGGD